MHDNQVKNNKKLGIDSNLLRSKIVELCILVIFLDDTNLFLDRNDSKIMFAVDFQN